MVKKNVRKLKIRQKLDTDRLMIRLDPELRAEWQAEADRDAGTPNAPLGAWIRAMVQKARWTVRQ